MSASIDGSDKGAGTPLEQPMTTLPVVSHLSHEEVDALVAEEIAAARAMQQNNKEKEDSDEKSDEEVDGKKKKKKKKAEKEAAEKVSIRELFQYADGWDRLLMALAIFFSLVNGASQPLMSLIFANLVGVFTDFTIDTLRGAPGAGERFNDGITEYIIYFVILAAGTFVAAYCQMAFLMIAGERQCKRIRELYYRAILRQEIAWFDQSSSGDLTSRLSSDITLMQEGMSEKLGIITQSLFTFVAGFVLAFVRGWKLALVMLSVVPLMMLSGALMSKFVADKSGEGQSAYGRAGQHAEEVLSSIKTIASFGGEQRECEIYETHLDDALKEGTRRGVITGIGIGSMIFIVFSSYALAFWFGANQVADGNMTGAEVLNVIFAMVIGAFALGNAAPSFAAIATAQGAAWKIFNVLKRESAINPSSKKGRRVNNLRGDIEFRGVDFSYPTRMDVPILQNFSLHIQPGETVALVGGSGSGKSTIVALLERFYDPVAGQVLIDKVDLKDINVNSLRQNIGMVGQEPVLFGVSIYQNIAWGAASEDVIPTREQVEQACRAANAHDFIVQLPEGYDTLVGEKGSLLSGGQKQRICIARALIKNPRILLLDEASSALDTMSEQLVQAALDEAAKFRTTIVVAHRLSTIRNADRIVVLRKGQIVEIGKHDELIAFNGEYAKLVRAQELKTIKGADKLHASPESAEEISSTEEDSEMASHHLKLAKTKDTVRSERDLKAEREAREAELDKRSLPWRRIIVANMPEKWLILFACLGALVDGAVMPVFALVFSEVLSIFSLVDNPEKLRNDGNFWALMFEVLAMVSFFSVFSRVGIFGVAGERLTHRLRMWSFRAMVKQEMGFFDMPENGTGALNAKLSTEAEQIRGLSGQLVGSIIQATTSLVVGLVIAFINGWQLTLVVLACVPLIGAASGLQIKTLAGYGGKTKRAYEDAAQIACESVDNMRTVASLASEERFAKLYSEHMKAPHRLSIRGALLSSIGYGLSQALIFLVYSVAFYYGSRLVYWGTYDVDQMFRILFSVVFAAVGAGQVASFTPSVAKAQVAAISLFDLIDRNTKIDPTNQQGLKPEPFNGNVDADQVRFTYPARPDVTVLRDFNAQVLAGKTVAIVGSSGSGKSTLVSLVQRFYDVDSGKVSVEKVSTPEWHLGTLRSHMSMVGQEPVLFARSIYENIAYGVDAGKNPNREMIIQAAKAANIHNFIESLPKGYDTQVGEKGSQLSGGQRQRIAIARALLRNPRLLLLDEATSALDSESEKVVQDALDRAAKGRTTITIAHRLSTIQNADLILVVKNGTVVEQGKHFDLIAKRGLYFNLVQKQTLQSNA